ncbi:dihydrolipoyl dehydrogenase [Rhodanobacter denitrificans]|uniref:Dihydrolipoyl dehydrogenase n=1 Tax=Rhodanobacter denitrificans TaxID=666685 RepID=M4NKC4_9GAMM|nr:dihydrolipoyl dehydrogenase [Rhodanobacter denitrificans]AGG90517.1 dihydrolipoamide dehydrogenase [Rhodanobacter denitrificans]UJM85900.1 dihydrolipoyl dehydrogenase [Rhodanobacter denitrificans]UJM91068.1 dihydrolipoyl dehydrogenase [Rhodanobacter denitrificans]
MANTIEIKVPDIGGHDNVPVIEVLVKAGDTVAKEQSLITLESDKATMEIPSSAAGVIRELKLKVGDEVSEGAVIAVLETVGTADSSSPSPIPGEGRGEGAGSPGSSNEEATKSNQPPASPVPSPQSSPRGGEEAKVPQAAASSGKKPDIECQLVVLGSGPGGYSAAFRAADLGVDTVLVERYGTLGGVCLNVGCIPSKALLHAAAVIDEAAAMAAHGVAFGAPKIDLDKLRSFKSKVVGQLTGGLATMAKQRKVRTLMGNGMFVSPHEMEVQTADGVKLLRFEHAIIAAGSQSVKLPAFPWDDERVMDSTGALELKDVPKNLLVVGGGIIGLEMATVYSALGSAVTVVEFMDQLIPGADTDLIRPLAKRLGNKLKGVHLKTKVVSAKATKKGIEVGYEGDSIPETTLFDRVLVAVGRSPNGNKIGADKAGVAVTERGFINVDTQMRTNVPHIFAIGDLVGQPMLAHKATHEAHVAAQAVAGQKSHFDARVIPSVAYTDPEIAWVGVTEREAKEKGLKVGVGKFPWAASGRAIGIDRTEGFTKLIFDEETHRIVGAGIVGVHAGDLISELALAIEMGSEAADIALTIHPHPTLGESVGMAAEVYEGTITDLYLPKKK